LTEYFRARLAEEVRRAERYGRVFSVVFVSCPEDDARDVFTALRPLLRASDIVEVIKGRERAPQQQAPEGGDTPPRGRDRVAIILPETGGAKAQAAVERLRNSLGALEDFSLGLAVYPDDATSARDLLNHAARSAGERFTT
jgi:hypothetical protein